MTELFLAVAQEHFGDLAGPHEGDPLVPVAQVGEHQIAGLEVRAAPVHRRVAQHRRVPECEVFAAARGTVFVDQGERAPGEILRQLLGIGDRGARTDETGPAPVVTADALQAPHHIGDIRAENAAVDMDLIANDVSQIRKEPGPAGVIGQNPRVQHVGIGEDESRLIPQLTSLSGRGVAIVGPGAELEFRCVPLNPLQVLELVLRQRLGREEEKGGRRRIVQQAFENGDQVAVGLAAGRTGHHDQIFIPPGPGERFGLVDVELSDALPRQRAPQRLGQSIGEFGELGFSRGNRLDMHQGVVAQATGLELRDHPLGAPGSCAPPAGAATLAAAPARTSTPLLPQ